MTGLAGMIAFGTKPAPPPLSSIVGVAEASIRRQPLPPLRRFEARDATALAFRAYPAAPRATPRTVAVLVHGSMGSSADMNLVGRALAAAGVAAYAPDIRSHGQSGRPGDIDHVGQLEEDLADLAVLVRRRHPGARLILVGHSSGGGFVLKAAGGEVGRMFDGFVLLAPFLGPSAPTARRDGGGWVAPYIPRIVGLTLLNRLGVTALDGLPTLAFAGPEGRSPRTWSFRLMRDFAPSGVSDSRDGGAYRRDAARVAGHIRLLAGDRDELFRADRYSQAFQDQTPPMPIILLKGVGHMGLISDPAALAAVVAAVCAEAGWNARPAPAVLGGLRP